MENNLEWYANYCHRLQRINFQRLKELKNKGIEPLYPDKKVKQYKLNEYIKHLPQDWDMVHFGYLKSDLVIKEKINEYYSTYEYKPGNQCFLVTKKACKILFENLNKPIQPSDSDMSERVVRKGLLKCYISNERLGYQIDGDDSNTIPKGSKKFYYDKEKK